MISILKKIFVVQAIIAILLFTAPAAFAAPSLWPTGYWGQGGLLSCNGETQACTFCDLLVTIQNVIYFGLTLLFFVFTPIMFAWGGLSIILSGASSGKIDTGKKILMSAVWGVVIGLSAFLIVNTFYNTLGIKLVGSTGGAVSWSQVSCGDLSIPFK